MYPSLPVSTVSLFRVFRGSGPGSAKPPSRLPPHESQPVAGGVVEVLADAQVAFGGLDRGVAAWPRESWICSSGPRPW